MEVLIYFFLAEACHEISTKACLGKYCFQAELAPAPVTHCRVSAPVTSHVTPESLPVHMNEMSYSTVSCKLIEVNYIIYTNCFPASVLL